MGGWVAWMCAMMLAVLLFVGRADVWVAVVVLAHASMLVELLSVVRLCWISWILFWRLRRGGGVAG